VILLPSLLRFFKDPDIAEGLFDTFRRRINTNPRRTPAKHVREHFLFYLSSKAWDKQKHKERNGALFEALVYDCLVRNGVPKDLIRTGIHFDKEKTLEGDLVIGRYVLMCKCSMRERWAQWDRAAILLSRDYPEAGFLCYGLHAVENHKRPFEAENLRVCKNIATRADSLLDVVSIFDSRGYTRLVHSILGEVS
jgi:hypothetical protein